MITDHLLFLFVEISALDYNKKTCLDGDNNYGFLSTNTIDKTKRNSEQSESLRSNFGTNSKNFSGCRRS